MVDVEFKYGVIELAISIFVERCATKSWKFFERAKYAKSIDWGNALRCKRGLLRL